ncbi:uncharacterized protein LOC113356821 [Papaver somniferum]|uniref:uncharacterized protein LOC113356821 n=1 Tax=Papaver somniferum TaxID=3469 RepID=UPI000E6F9789|nr:uncharacterized protein LOC113356821 [Papaver somniferum]
MVFILRNESDIKRFAIDWYRYQEDEDIVMKNVYRWIVQAVKRNVEEMRLEIRQGHPDALEIPHQLVNCKSLVNLKVQPQEILYKRLGSTDNVIKLTTPNIKAFECTSCVTQLYSLENCSLLSEVSFDFRLKEIVLGENVEAYCSFLSQEEVVLSRAYDLLDSQQQPCLFNVRSLYLKMRSTRGCLRFIAYLIKISPRVQSTLLYTKQSNLVDVGEDWEAGLSSEGMLSRLTYVCFCEVEGCDAELKLLSFLLKHGQVLTKVAVLLCWYLLARWRKGTISREG